MKFKKIRPMGVALLRMDGRTEVTEANRRL